MRRSKIAVLGGSGFLGREICRLGVAMGHAVVSVSRGGRPALQEPWVEGVEWVCADLLGAPEGWVSQLRGCEALVHAVGIAQEDAGCGQTFMRVHRDSVELAARAAVVKGVGKFVLISAAQLPAGLAHDYLQAKLDAEAWLEQIPELSVAILRPTFIYAGRPGLFGALAKAPEAQSELMRGWARRTRGLRLERVAMAALRAALQPQTVGVLELAAIDHLGDAMFIQAPPCSTAHDSPASAGRGGRAH